MYQVITKCINCNKFLACVNASEDIIECTEFKKRS